MFLLQMLLQSLEHYNFIMNRLEELIRQGRLLFVGAVQPKYVGDKIRVFKPSTFLRIGLIVTGLYAAFKTFSILNPNEVVIQYPSDPNQFIKQQTKQIDS